MPTENPSTQALFDHLLRIININGLQIREKSTYVTDNSGPAGYSVTEVPGDDLTPVDNPYSIIAEEIKLGQVLSTDPNVGSYVILESDYETYFGEDGTQYLPPFFQTDATLEELVLGGASEGLQKLRLDQALHKSYAATSGRDANAIFDFLRGSELELRFADPSENSPKQLLEVVDSGIFSDDVKDIQTGLSETYYLWARARKVAIYHQLLDLETYKSIIYNEWVESEALNGAPQNYKYFIFNEFADAADGERYTNNASWGQLTPEQVQIVIDKAEANYADVLRRMLYVQFEFLNEFPELDERVQSDGTYQHIEDQIEVGDTAYFLDTGGAQSDEFVGFRKVWILAGGGADDSFFNDLALEQIPQEEVVTPIAEPIDTEDEVLALLERSEYIEQCYLLSNLVQIAKIYKESYRAKFGVTGSGKVPYGGGVIPITSKTPELIMNYFTYPEGLQNYFTSKYKNYKQTFKLFRTTDVDGVGSVFTETITNSNLAEVKDLTTTIKIAGSNPASAKSNSVVDIDFEMPKLSSLRRQNMLSNFERPGFVSGSKGFQKWEKKQYHPFYYRKLAVYGIEGTDGDGAGNNQIPLYGMDYTLVDHTISTDEKFKLKVNLNNQGYQQQFLNLPYLDVIGGKSLLKRRRQREDYITDAIDANCSEETIKDLQKSFDVLNPAELKNFRGNIVKRLTELKLMSYAIVEKSTLAEQYDRAAGLQNDQFSSNNISFHYTTSGTDEGFKFFYLGDLLYVVSEMFYKSEFSDQTKHGYFAYDKEFFPGLQFKILTLPFNYTDPLNSAGAAVQINLAEIPISVKWFSEYLNEKYFSKNLEYVAIGPFIRELVQGALTSMVTEVCFSDEIETKLQFGVSYQKGYIPDEFANNDLWFQRLKTLFSDNNRAQDYLKPQNIATGAPLFALKSDIGLGLRGLTDDAFYDYIIIHPILQQKVTKEIVQDVLESNGQTGDKEKFTLKDNSEVLNFLPIISNAVLRTDSSDITQAYVKAFSYKKVEGKYWREMRMMSFQNNNFRSLGNVYNCTVDLNFLAPWFVPGNYVILDPYTGENGTYKWYDTNGIAYQLGMSGLYCITEVNHTFNTPEKKFTTQLTCDFLSALPIDPTIKSAQPDTTIDIKESSQTPNNEVCQQFDALASATLLGTFKDIAEIQRQLASISRQDDADDTTTEQEGTQQQSGTEPTLGEVVDYRTLGIEAYSYSTLKQEIDATERQIRGVIGYIYTPDDSDQSYFISDAGDGVIKARKINGG